jgi:hypothetical protein
MPALARLTHATGLGISPPNDRAITTIGVAIDARPARLFATTGDGSSVQHDASVGGPRPVAKGIPCDALHPALLIGERDALHGPRFAP